MPCMNPAFNPRLDLTSNGQTILARGPCSWDEDDESAEIGDVTVYQGASSRRARGRARCGRTVTVWPLGWRTGASQRYGRGA